ncbi:MAG TPA: ATP-binding protein [Myxococcales bacterium]|nr:ATP-binding protein [Myxococcales bacterium]HET9751570.1 ATP-binding protein [Myxococcales bacterium]
MRLQRQGPAMLECGCNAIHQRQRIVLTGGPGAGKTAVLELARSMLCRHLRVLPESASILFGGGFPRVPFQVGREAAQIAIFAVQRQVEALEDARDPPAVALCDRGTVDALAYWPGSPEEFWARVRSSREVELARYAAVIHMRPPGGGRGWDNRNPLRPETAVQAAELDRRIAQAWDGHPRRRFIESSPDFLAKARRAIDALCLELPACCRPAFDAPRT